MFVNVFLRRILPFFLAVVFGITAIHLTPPSPSVVRFEKGLNPASSGSASCSGPDGWDWINRTSDRETDAPTRRVVILSKLMAAYTQAARENNVQGSVRLKVTFAASGQIGAITPVKRLPDGLTEQAVAAARKIKFEPERVSGVPVTTAVTIDYSFTIY